jgi:mRNA interferase MazF
MTSAGIIVKQRDIALISFPFSDLSATKKRPALVVSNDSFNSHGEDAICCLITSNPEETPHSVFISNKDMESGHLEFDSKVKPHKLFTADKRLILKTLGKLGSGKFAQVVKEINKIIS